ncbi:hypothetical protein D477_009825, partial [Arthrobacter crystallopoietes BAB-32]
MAAGVLAAGITFPAAGPAVASEEITTTAEGSPSPLATASATQVAQPAVELEILKRTADHPELKFAGRADRAAGKTITIEIYRDGEWKKLWTSTVLDSAAADFEHTHKLTETGTLKYRAAVDGTTVVSETVEAAWTRPVPSQPGPSQPAPTTSPVPTQEPTQ